MATQSHPETEQTSPFHPGERFIQDLLGVRDVAERRGKAMFKSALTEQHRKFFEQLPYVITGHIDEAGQLWAGLIVGQPGFITSSDSGNAVHINLKQASNPVEITPRIGTGFALLGIDFSTKRRNRVNTTLKYAGSEQWDLIVQQAYGNCPKYIVKREWRPQWFRSKYECIEADRLTNIEKTLITRAETFFIATASGPKKRYGQNNSQISQHAWGADVSHRGGESGFIMVQDNQISFVDYPGNNLFNTLGNLQQYPYCGLLILDFETGAILQITGKGELKKQTDQLQTSITIAQKRFWLPLEG